MEMFSAIYFDLLLSILLIVASIILIVNKVPYLRYLSILLIPLGLFYPYRILLYVEAHNLLKEQNSEMIHEFKVHRGHSEIPQDFTKISNWLGKLEYFTAREPYNFSNASIVTIRFKSGETLNFRVLYFDNNDALIKLVSGNGDSYFSYGYYFIENDRI